MSAADLARWEPRWRERNGAIGRPEPLLVEKAALLGDGPVLDVAAGDGRNALWLARQGLAVTAVDISPAAIDRLETGAMVAGAIVQAHTVDLDEPDALLGLGPFASLLVIRFKPSPTQWNRLLDRLAPRGRVLLCSFRPEQHERHGFPLAHCLGRAELEAALEARLRLEGWWDIDDDDEFLAGSLWQRRSG
jgi:SAM-dependent methyltransferase